MKIIADTATLIAPRQGPEHGMTVLPVCVSIDNQSYQDYTQITSEEFLQRIAQGGVPSSSQPAVESILQRLHHLEEGAEHRISVCHGGARQRGEKILQQVRERFPAAETELLELSPALITHGGPGCIVIQAIRK